MSVELEFMRACLENERRALKQAQSSPLDGIVPEWSGVIYILQDKVTIMEKEIAEQEKLENTPTTPS